jgi:trimeric autotransporter adhesin
MKRKYLSALLMGVLTLSSVSTFTSCKDYDDDISNLQGQIDKLATADQLSQKVAELQALISSNKSDITSLQSELAKKTTLDEVKAVLADYATKQYVNDADKTLQDAIDALKTGDIAKLKEDVKAAQAAADKAAKDAEAANAEIVETLKTLATKTELKDAADAAQKAIEALESKNAEDLKKAQEAITETLKSYATKSDVEEGDKKTLESLAETIKNASDALKQANDNKATLAAVAESLGKGYSKENTVADAIKAIQAQIGTPNKELGTLDTRLAAIESVLNGVKDDDTKLGLATKVTNIENKLKDIIGEYTTMVTSVSLVGSYHLDVDAMEFYDILRGKADLKFMSDNVAADLTFGKGQKDDNGVVVPEATNQQTYKKGTPFNNETSIVVRVNPTNAELTKNTTIKLVDSKGRDLSDVLELGTPERFNTLLSRASAASGLWTIPVKVKAGVATDKIEQKVGGTGADKDNHVLYAVAIKNTATEKDAQDRYVTSTYDLTVQKPTNFTAATSLKDVKIWSETTMGYDHAITLDQNKKTTSDLGGAEVSAKNNEKINIDFSAYKDQIQYFYVVRDDSHVDSESGTSAINAWNSYKYTGLGQVVKADEGGVLTVDINKGQVGDEIGFRIFAVNYNGTLVPSTGDSFVVYVGEQQNQASVAGSINVTTVSNNATGWLPITGTLKDGVRLTPNLTAIVNGQPIDFTVQYAANNKGAAPVKDGVYHNSLIKYVKFTCTSDMSTWKDDAKAVFTISQKDANDKMVENEINVTLTKVLPTVESTKKLMGYTWKDEQLVGDTYTAYVYPVNGWTTAGSAKGYKDLDQAITGLRSNFVVNIANLQKDDKNQYTVSQDFTASPWRVTVDNGLIDGTTKHATNISYNYGKISSEKKNEAGAIVDYVVSVETVQTIFACPLKKGVQTYSWGKLGVPDGETTKYVDVNYLTYGNENAVVSNLFDFIIGHNDFDNTVFGGKLSALAKNKYVDVTAKLISNGSKQQDYFIAHANPTTGTITFEKKSGTTNPVKDVASTLIITVKDAFGHTYEYPMDFTVKRAK